MKDAPEKKSEAWLKEAQRSHWELFSEFDVLLKALDSFFVIENLPTTAEAAATKNFHNELTVVNDTILRALSIVETIIPERARNIYWFQKFAEGKLIWGKERELAAKEMYRQDTEEKSFFVLYDSLVKVKSIVLDMLKNPVTNFMSFKNVGQFVGKELRTNIFFDPSKRDIDPELDIIENRAVTKIVKEIKEKDIRKDVSIIFLHMFRLLRYLKHVRHSATKPTALNRSIPILLLFKSEIESLRKYMGKFSERTADQDLKTLLNALSYQLSMESKRVFDQELRNVFERQSHRQMRGKIENSHGILKNLTEQVVIQLSRFWDTEIKEEEIFEMVITRTGQSIKLREDIYVLHRIIDRLGEVANNLKAKKIILDTLTVFMEYFENFTFKLLRYDDYEQFSSMFETVKSTYENEGFDEFMSKCHQLNVLLETTLNQIAQRAELIRHPLDISKAEDIVKQYLPIL
jgi:hypothetical protein